MNEIFGKFLVNENLNAVTIVSNKFSVISHLTGKSLAPFHLSAILSTGVINYQFKNAVFLS